MTSLLIVNADDFGLSKGLNYGVAEAHLNGVVTSTSTMVNGMALKHAVELSTCLPKLAIGMHFVLTFGRPLSPMPLLSRNETLGKWIWQMSEQDILPLDEIANELECQYQYFVTAFGRAPSHIDSHHHVHMLPKIYPLVADFAQSKGVALRIDRQILEANKGQLNEVRTSDGFSSEFYGDAITEELFLDILDSSTARGEQSLEMMTHPSFVDNQIISSQYCYQRLIELDILTSSSLKQAITERNYRLGTYYDC